MGNKQKEAKAIIGSLRKGIPPQKGVSKYSVGYDKLLRGIENNILPDIEDQGIIRFANGSWGAGKTHFFRLLKERCLNDNILVANVELNNNETPFNKFEMVLSAIFKSIITPSAFQEEEERLYKFGRVLIETVNFLSSGTAEYNENISVNDFETATEKLMADRNIDIDFKKIIKEYWKTFLANEAASGAMEEKRGELLQWFSGEGVAKDFRKNYEVNKMVSKSNAKMIFSSLAAFVKMAGYNGFAVLFDEAEMGYSTMRKSQLRDSHNNLLSLIDNVAGHKGLLLIYATTPDFFNDEKHGIKIYGALAGRIGKLQDESPRSLSLIWNLDALEFSLENYQDAAIKIRDLYLDGYQNLTKEELGSDEKLKSFVKDLHAEDAETSLVRFWRILLKSLIDKYFDPILEGEKVASINAEEAYYDSLDQLKEE